MHCFQDRPSVNLWRRHAPPPPRRSGKCTHKSTSCLPALIEEGLINTVQRQLMSGKEAMVFVVRCGDETRCAKVYKEATHRSFRQAVDYTENRKVKNSRQARAMAKGTRFGVDLMGVMREIDDARSEEAARLLRMA